METGAAAPKSTAVGTEEIDFAFEAENRGMKLVSSTRVSCAEFKCLFEDRSLYSKGPAAAASFYFLFSWTAACWYVLSRPSPVADGNTVGGSAVLEAV